MKKVSTEERVTISVVTATFNAANYLPHLIESLRSQTDKDFEWVVADGASSDATLALLEAASDLNVVILSQPDFGVYDALNRAIKRSSGRYYIVAGADDIFYPDAIENYRNAIERAGADIISANVMYGSRCMKVKKGPSWIFGQFSHIAAHSLATAFNKDLHYKFGFYSRWYPIAADQLFVMSACNKGALVGNGGFVAGEIGQEGVSSIDRVGNATEVFRVQVALGNSKTMQVLLFILRLLRTR